MPHLNRSEILLFACPLIIGGIYFLNQTELKYLIPLNRRSEERRRMVCSQNLEALGMALTQYCVDDAGREVMASRSVGLTARSFAGPTGTAPVGWAEAIDPYLKSHSVLGCPSSTATQPDPAMPAFTSYWYNDNLSGVAFKGEFSAAEIFQVGEGDSASAESDATYSLRSFPSEWLADHRKPPFRHYNRANYLFFDGHVEGIAPAQFSRPGSGPGDFFGIKLLR